jgi:hypothetical protein
MISARPGGFGQYPARQLHGLAARCNWGIQRVTNVLPENNTLFGAALRTISQLLDNGNSVFG